MANFSLVLPREINPLVAVLIRKGLKFRLGGGEGARVLWTVLYSRGLKLAFVSAYIRHSTGEGSDDLSRALAKASGV